MARQILENSPDLIGLLSSGRIEFLNPAGARLLGVGAVADALGRRWEELATLEAPPGFSGTLSPGPGFPSSPISFEGRLRRPDGSSVDVEVRAVPAPGSPDGVLQLLMRDITDRKLAEQQMRATLKELKDVKAALDEHSIVAMTDAAGVITYVNDKFCKISKYPREELLGVTHRIINSGHHPAEFFVGLWRTIASGRVWQGQIRNRAKDGSLYWVETTIFPFLDAAGRPLQYVAIRTDITARKQDEERLAQYTQELAEKNKELETIVYVVSHDLRSPLINVQGFSQELSRSVESLQAKVPLIASTPGVLEECQELLRVSFPRALKFILAGSMKMDALLTGFLRFSRLGRAALMVGEVDVNVVVAGVLQAVRFQLESAHAVLEVGPLPSCKGDATYLAQVFANLVDNAIKYRDPSRALLIRIVGARNGDQSVYSVSDNGIGIAPAHQPKVFEIFHRLNPAATPGEGMGLTIAQRILERQQGRIWLESTPGKGSTFFVSLPACSAPH